MKKVFTILLLLPVFANAVTKYIDPAGSNGNTGAIGSPWLTLTYACTQVTTPGDIIHVNAGTYIETAQSVLAVGVSIEGVGVTSIIKSHVSTVDVFTILLSSASQGTNGNQHIWNIKMDGDALTGYGAIYVYQRSNVEISGCTFIDFVMYGVGFWGFPATATGGASPPTTYATGNKFHDNIVNNCSGVVSPGNRSTASFYFALGINGQDGMLIYSNTMNQYTRALGSNGFLIKGVMGYNRDIKIYSNILNRKDQGDFTLSWDFAIELWDCRGGIEIYNNIINGSIDIGGYHNTKTTYSYCAYIHNNTIGQDTLHASEQYYGVILEADIEYITIAYNSINNITTAVSFSQNGGSRTANNISIYYNLMNNIGVTLVNGNGRAIDWNSNTSNNIVGNIYIWNNTIISHDGLGVNFSVYGMRLPDIGTTRNVSVRNNIIQGFGQTAIYASGASGQTIDTLSIENNTFYQNGNSNTPLYSSITPTHNTTQNNLTSNPLFVSGSDFHLQSGSPAINAGVNVGLTQDINGNPIVGLPDMGAYEFYLSCMCFIHKGLRKYYL